MANPFLLAVIILLTIAGIAGLVLFMLRPTKEELVKEDAINDQRVSSQWAGGLDGGGGGGGGGGPLH